MTHPLPGWLLAGLTNPGRCRLSIYDLPRKVKPVFDCHSPSALPCTFLPHTIVVLSYYVVCTTFFRLWHYLDPSRCYTDTQIHFLTLLDPVESTFCEVQVSLPMYIVWRAT